MTVWAFDIETVNWDSFLLGGAVGGIGAERRRILFRTPQQIVDWYESTGPKDLILSHFGGRFDFLYLIDLIRCPWNATLSGSGIISMKAAGHAECRDTYRFAPLSLDAWSGKKTVQVLPCICPEKCRGYCAFSHSLRRADYNRVADYCLHDCEILLDVWTEYVERLESAGVRVRNSKGDVRRTIGGIAWATLSEMCDVGATPDHETYQAELQSYYGGRVEVFRTVAETGHRDDVNSMYTWGLLQPTPTGVCTVIDRAPDALRAFARQSHGCYDATVKTPAGRFPLVPRRGKDSAIIWATGETRGVYTQPELQSAVDHGASVEIHTARTWPTLARVYEPWVTLAYGIRERAAEAGDKSMRAYAKWLCNSASGKLCQGIETQSLYIRPSDEQLMRWVQLPDNVRNERLRALGKNGDVFVDTSRRQVPASARPIHGAYMISRARLALLARLERAGDDALYCDTDAVYSRRDDATDRDDVRLGAWKYEGAMCDWHATAPKLYRYTPTSGEGAGRIQVKAKGIPKADPEKYDALRAGGSVALDVGVETVKTALDKHGRAFIRKASARSLQASPRLAGLRYILPDGATVAPHRAADGGYSWPGIDAIAADITPRLRPGK